MLEGVIAPLLGYVGMTSMSAVMPKHYRQMRPSGLELSPSRRRVYRAVGAALLLLAAGLCVNAQGLAIGLVHFCGVLTIAALASVAVLSFKPRWSVPLAVLALITAATLACLMLLNSGGLV